MGLTLLVTRGPDTGPMRKKAQAERGTSVAPKFSSSHSGTGRPGAGSAWVSCGASTSAELLPDDLAKWEGPQHPWDPNGSSHTS